MSARCISRRRSLETGAFSLVELLVAMAVFAVLVVVLSGMVDSVMRLWKASENRAESYREARAALSLISSDLRSAIATTNTNYFSTTAEPNFEASAEDGAMFFIAALPAGAQARGNLGDLCEVGYYLKFGVNGVSGQTNEYSMMRFFKGSDETATNLLADSGIFRHSAEDVELLARHIPFFKVRCFTTQADGSVVPWRSSAQTPLPTFLEMELVAYNSSMARRLTTAASWKDKNSPAYVKNSRAFTVRVALQRLE
jgi:prepilin-type N-terminal cleavage/methylation domain-containing protein